MLYFILSKYNKRRWKKVNLIQLFMELDRCADKRQELSYHVYLILLFILGIGGSLRISVCVCVCLVWQQNNSYAVQQQKL